MDSNKTQTKNISPKNTKPLHTPIRYIKGVGPKIAEYLGRLDIVTVEDLLYHLPRRYEDRSKFSPIKEAPIGKYSAIKGEVLTFGVRRSKKGMQVLEVAVGDRSGVIYGVWFNQPFLKKFFKVGQRIVLYGKVERYKKLQMNQPEYEILKENEEAVSIHIGKITPIYPLTQDVNQRFLRNTAKRALDGHINHTDEILPTPIRARNKLVDIRFAIYNIHFPSNFDALNRAYRRIVFDEFFILQVAVALKRSSVKIAMDGLKHELKDEWLDTFKDNLPFELTKGQEKVIREIEQDMVSEKKMNRLLQGDVGSGKTVVAAYAAYLTVKNGHQAAIMVPTEILAEQHYVNLLRLFLPLNMRVELLVSGLSDEAKNQAREGLANGEVDIIIGTHSLIQETVDFKKLGLIVVDEQHKFGVGQRAQLRKKGWNPDVLVMTATPIPRTLALTVYGDLDISTIKEKPTGRREILTYLAQDAERDKVYELIRGELKKGRQAYIVSPRIEGSPESLLKSATEMYEELRSRPFKDFSVGLIHGKMSTEEKEKVMSHFKKGNINILVSTVVIEVGIDVPNATVMVIENAERFGLSQLHQLRGRIGRGEHISFCILLGDPKTDASERRLAVMVESSDGFKIAEEDLDIRGPGEIFGTRQHGLPEVRFGNIARDMEIMDIARKEAFELVRNDSKLADSHNAYIREELNRRFRGKLDLIKVG